MEVYDFIYVTMPTLNSSTVPSIELSWYNIM